MKYENAKNILPSELLLTIQQYVHGTCLYVPVVQADICKLKQSLSESKALQRQRNELIFKQYQSGIPVINLAQQHYLSKQAIYKILRNFE